MAKTLKKKGLPFVIEPKYEPIKDRIGTEESGIIEIERRGYLTVQEKAIVQGAMEGDTTMTDMFMLCREIAQQEGLKPDRVFSDMSAPTQPEYFMKYNDKISAVMVRLTEYQDRQRMIAATAMLICRIDRDWSAEDTIALHPDLLDALYVLYMQEDQKSVEALKGSVEKKGPKADSEGKG